MHPAESYTPELSALLLSKEFNAHLSKDLLQTRVKHSFTPHRARQIPSINIQKFYEELGDKKALCSSGKGIALTGLNQ